MITKTFSSLLFLLLSLYSTSAQTPIDGPWHGMIGVGGSELGIEVTFTRSGDSLAGTIDIPQQQAMDLPLRNVRQQGDSLTFDLPVGPGVATFAGIRSADSVAGVFGQGEIAGTFGLRRGRRVVISVPEAPVPYLQEEVTFTNGNVTLAGTLTMPKGKGPFPAVVLISGSGPQDRDEEIYGFRPFKVIADHLTRSGIAVLRYDDRGVGGSSGDVASSTSQDFAGDVISAVALLKSRRNIRGKKIGLMGHSEGGIIAPMVATRSNDVAFIILMAGTGIRGDELLYAQGRAIARAAGVPDPQIDLQQQVQRRVFDAVRADRIDSLKVVLLAEARSQPGLTAEQSAGLGTMLDRQLAMTVTPWFRYFLEHDPAPVLGKVRVPVLMLFGALDTQVPAELNRAAMEKALKEGGNRNYRTVVFPTANHLFIEAKTGGVDEYATAKKELVPGFLDAVTGFVKKQ